MIVGFSRASADNLATCTGPNPTLTSASALSDPSCVTGFPISAIGPCSTLPTGLTTPCGDSATTSWYAYLDDKRASPSSRTKCDGCPNLRLDFRSRRPYPFTWVGRATSTHTCG